MVSQPSSARKRATARNSGVSAQNKKALECILGCCNHGCTSKTCTYWNKVVDSDDPAKMQMKLIIKLFGGR